MNVNLNYVTNPNNVELTSKDSLLLIGKSKDLRQVQFHHLSKQLDQLEIPHQFYTESINYVAPVKKDKSLEETSSESKPASGSSVSWLNRFIIQSISGKVSRNNTPSRAHLITKQIASNSFSDNQLILVIVNYLIKISLIFWLTYLF